MISMKQLRYFDALARFGHFGRAADQCSVTQPALSMQISQLERDLGITLVERRSNGIVLTVAGREIARRAAAILLDIRALSEFADGCRAPFSAPIRLGVIPTIAPYLLPRLLPRLREDYPQLALHIRETQTHTLVADLLATDLDLLVVALPIAGDDMATMEVRQDRFLLAVPAADPGYPFSPISPDFLLGERLLLLEEGHCFRDQALALCSTRRLGGTELLGAASLSTLVQMVANGLGVTLLPEIGAPHESAHGGVRLVRFSDPEPRRTIGLAWRKSSPRHHEFTEIGNVIKRLWPD